MANIKALIDLDLRGHLSFGKRVAEFPANPKPGMTCFKDGILFFYSDIGGYLTWYPLNSPRSTYVHSQGVPAIQWTINHRLETTDVIVGLYDNDGNAMEAGVQTKYTPSNPDGQKYQVIVTFTEAVDGVAVVFGRENWSSPAVEAETINAQSITVNNVPVVIESDLIAGLQGLTNAFNSYQNAG